jgi:tumor protein p53-inducible protein 3
LKGGNFNAVLDCVGSDNYESTIELLDVDGKWILFGLLSGFKTNLNLALLLAKRISLISTTLKTRSGQYKDNLIADFTKTALWAFDKQELKPIIYKTITCDWTSAEPFIDAHRLMESNANVGKIMIEFK